MELNDKTHIIRVNQASVRVACDCGVDYTHNLGTWKCKTMGDSYENLMTHCPECEQTTIFNLNLPESEFDEQEIYEAPHYPPGEKEAREQVRALMWKVRPDLTGKDRAAFEKQKRQEVEKRYGLPLEAIQQNAQRVANVRRFQD